MSDGQNNGANDMVISEFVRGVRHINGTDHPVVYQLRRDRRGTRRPTWIVLEGLCNGVPDEATEHRTLTAARRRYEELAAVYNARG